MAPHNLAKYASTYNKHGRVGIYTSKERAAIILRFKAKRERRMWHKKVLCMLCFGQYSTVSLSYRFVKFCLAASYRSVTIVVSRLQKREPE